MRFARPRSGQRSSRRPSSWSKSGLGALLVGLVLLAGAALFLGKDLAKFLPDRATHAPRGSDADLRGAVTHVRDGDTVEVAGTPVRLANLDCAERGSVDGEAASARMRALVDGHEVACELEGRMSYDREVGTCALATTGEDLGRILIDEGTCGRWR